MRTFYSFLLALLLVDGVFGVEKANVSVMEGDSVTLNPSTVIPEDDSVEWWFGEESIARMNNASKIFSTYNGTDGRFRDRLKLDKQNGSLTITNITTEHTGLYKLKIKSRTVISKIFNVTVRGVEKADVSVSVMEGDSVTLNPSTVIPEDDTVEWWFGGESIARMNNASKIFSTYNGTDGRFRDRLKLDKQNGSLTITNIRTGHTGLYKLKIMSRTVISKIFNVTVRDKDVVESVSVMEGDSVTLHTGVTDIQTDNQIVWKFKDEVLRTDGLNGWSKLNDQTGGITIRNIRRDQSGVYEVEINTSSMILHRKLCINISGEMNTVSVMEGNPVILYTGVIEIQGYDLILWKFGDHLIAEIDKVANRFLTHDSSAGGRFKGRLQPSEKSGSLIISGSRTTDSGDYHLHMNSSSHTLQRSIGVTVSTVPDPGLSSAVPDPGLSSAVPDPGLSAGAVAGIVVAVLLVVFAAVIIAGVIYHRRKISELQSRRDVVKGTNRPLKPETANSDAL